MTNKTFKLFTDKMGGRSADAYIGNAGEIFYNPDNGALKISDGVTVGGNPIHIHAEDVIYDHSIIPETDNTYSLGSANYRWKEIFIGPGSLYIKDVTLGTNAALTVDNGVLKIDGANQLQVGQLKFINNTIESTTGNIDIEIGGTGATADLVLNRNTVVTAGKSLTVDGNLKLINGGIRKTGNQDLFITAVDNAGVIISSIGLQPNNKHTRLEQWSGQYSESWTTADWATGTYTVEGGQGVVRFTNAPNIISFVDSLLGDERMFFSVNGGPQLVSVGLEDGDGNIEFYTPTPPATDPTTVTSFTYYFSYESGLDIDYNSEEFNIFGANLNINIETVGQKLINIKSFNDLNLESRNLFTLKNRSANDGIQIQTDSNNSGPIWEFGTDGRTTFPNGTVPEHSYGAAGDKEGMVVFSDPYIYYCKQDYVNTTTDIWVRVAWTGTNW
jgi:hypothetical protein